MKQNENTQAIHGKLIDDNTRCVHFHSLLDIIAIRFKCCGTYYPCYQCHEETAGHAAVTWKKEEWDNPAIFCGLCKNELTINEYMSSGNQCPNCNGMFNPNCSKHYHLYFEI
jgi:uncharacterized CHY-type Zn-finger protein